MSDRLTPEGYDRIGPFHPWLVWAAVVVFDLALLALIVTFVLAGADWTEDLIWPGGPEVLPF